MPEDWQVYLTVGLVVFFMLLGKKLMFFSNDKKNKK